MNPPIMSCQAADAIVNRWARHASPEARATLRSMVRAGHEAGWNQANGSKTDQQILKEIVQKRQLIIDRLLQERDDLEARNAALRYLTEVEA